MGPRRAECGRLGRLSGACAVGRVGLIRREFTREKLQPGSARNRAFRLCGCEMGCPRTNWKDFLSWVWDPCWQRDGETAQKGLGLSAYACQVLGCSVYQGWELGSVEAWQNGRLF